MAKDDKKSNFHNLASRNFDYVPKDFNEFTTALQNDPKLADRLHSDMLKLEQQGYIKNVPKPERIREVFGVSTSTPASTTTQAPPPTQATPPVQAGGAPTPTPTPKPSAQMFPWSDELKGLLDKQEGTPQQAPEATPTELPKMQDGTQMPMGGGLGKGQFQITDTTQQQQAPALPPVQQVQAQTTATGSSGVPSGAETQTGIPYMDALANAVQRGYNRGEIADYITAMGKTPDGTELKKIAEITKANDKLATSEYMKQFSEDPSVATTILSLPEIAIESIASLYRHGLARMGAGAAMGAGAGSIVPGVGTAIGAGTGALAGMSVAGLGVEVSSTILDSFRELGVDITNEKALEVAFKNPQIMGYAKNMAYSRGIPIAVFDAVSMGVAGKILGKPASTVARKIGQIAGEAVVQGSLGAAGEASAQAISGQEFKPYEILAEGLAEIPGSVPEVGIAMIGKRKASGADTKLDVNKLAVDNPDMPANVVSEIIDVSVGTGELSGQQADEIKADFAKAQEINATIPEDIKEQGSRITAIGIIEERNNLTAKLETVDEAFKPQIQEKIKALNQQLQELGTIGTTPEAQTFFDTNEASLTNPIATMPAEVETTFGKISDGILISPEGLSEAYNWVNESFKAVIGNQALSPAEKGATLNILNGMLSDIDKANTEGQKFVEEVETASVQDRVPAVREGVATLPEGQRPSEAKAPVPTPSITKAREVKQKTNVLPSSGEVIVTPASKGEVATEAVVETPATTEQTTETQVTPTEDAVQVEATTEVNPALADVESTAKDTDEEVAKNIQTAKANRGFTPITDNPPDLRTPIESDKLYNNGFSVYRAKDSKGNAWVVAMVGYDQFGGRTGYTMAMIKDDGNLPANIEDTLTLKASEEWFNSPEFMKDNKGTQASKDNADRVRPMIEAKVNEIKQKQESNKKTPDKNESKATQEKPLLEGVRDGGTEGKAGQESAQLRTEETGKPQATKEGEVGKQAPDKKTLSEEFGISAEDVNNLVEQKRKTFEGYSIDMALQELGVPQDKIKDALPAYVAEMLEGTLPTKSPTKKQKIDEDLIPVGEIKIQPIESKGKGKPAKTTAEKIDLVSDATDTKSTREYETVIHKNADSKEVVGTDSTVLIVVKDNSITETESIDAKTGQKRNVKYPDYKSIIPDTAKRKDKKNVNAKTIYELASGIAKATKMFTGRIIPARIVIGDTEVFLSAERLKQGLEPFVRSGITDIEVSIDGSNRAVVFKGGDITSLVMPVEYSGRGAGYTTVISEEQATPATKQQATAQTTPTANPPTTLTQPTPEAKPKSAMEQAREARRQAQAKAKQPTQDQRVKAREAYFKPGAIVESYGGGKDRVIEYNQDPNDPSKWSVTVQQVDAQGNPVGEPRTHKTEPSDKEYKRAGVEVVAEKTTAPPTPTEVKENSEKVYDDAQSTFVFPIGLNPKFKFDVRLPENVKRFFKKYFRPRGLWTPELFKGKRSNEGRIASQAERAKFKIRDLQDAISKSYPKGVKESDVKRMNEFLQGNAIELPPALYKPLEAMRDDIDRLSRIMIEEGIIDQKLVPVFNANMGMYTTRTYDIHNDPESWISYIKNTPEGEQVRNKAVNWLRQGYEAKADRADKLADKSEARAVSFSNQAQKTQDPDKILELEYYADRAIQRADKLRAQAEALRQGDFDAKIDAFLFDESQPLGIVKKGKYGSKDLGILQKRKDIPEAIRELMGEVQDPITNYTMSVAKMASLISNNKFLNDAKVQGLKDGTFTTEAKGKNIVQIASESTDSMNPLNGLYTTEEIAQAFDEYQKVVESPDYIKLMLRLNGMIKLGKTVLSPTTHVRNFGSNILIEVGNGSFSLKGLKEAVASQYEQVFGLKTSDRKEKVREYVEKLIKLGVLGSGANYGDMLAYYDDIRSGGKYDYQKVIEPKLTGGLNKGMNAIKNLYRAEDDFFKVHAFEDERATLKKAYGNTKTDEQLDELAAEKVLKTRINYDMAPKIVDAIRKIPVMGTFPTFPAEVVRISANIPMVAVEEMRSGNKVLQKRGVQRMAGYMIALTLPSALNNLSKYLLDIDDEEEEARKLFIAPWSQNSTLVWLDKDRYVDTGYSDAFNTIKTPVVAALKGADLVAGGVAAIMDFVDPYITGEIGYKMVKEIADNRDEYDSPVYNENADVGTKAAQIFGFAMKKAEPGFVSQAKRFYKGETGELAEKGQKYSTKDELLNLTLGQKVVTVDWDNAVLFKLKANAEDIKDSNSFYNKANKQLPEKDKKGRVQEAEATNLAVERSVEQLREYYNATKAMGFSTAKTVRLMKEANIPKDIILAIATNQPYKNFLIVTKSGTVIDRNTQRLLGQ